MFKKIVFQEEARQAILRGMYIVAEAVGSTLGPRGQTVILGRQIGPALVTKDGVTVASQISLEDPLENEGAKLILHVAQKTNLEAGDGTTAATILTHAIFKEGLRQITAGADSQAVERGIRLAVSAVVAELKKLATPVLQSDIDLLSAVATIAANGDSEMGKVIGKAIHHAGLEGSYSMDPSPTAETTLEIADGLQFDRGLLNPAFMENRAHGTTVYEACNVFITDRRLIDSGQMQTFLVNYYRTAGEVPLLLIAEDFEGAALQFLVVNNGRSVRVCPVRTPGSGATKKEHIEDIAILTGSKAYLVAQGDDPVNARLEDFGSADRVIVTPHRTTIIGGHGAAVRVDARKDELRSRIADPETKEFMRAELERRLAALSASIAVIKIGAGVNAKLLEKRDRAEDSLNATLGALKEGIVPGGGTALVRTLPALMAFIETLDGDTKLGAQIISRAIIAPLHRLAANAGQSGDVVVQTVIDLPARNDAVDGGVEDQSVGLVCKDFGYNAAEDRYEDMVAAGVIDPVKVVRLALEYSSELAGLLLTSAALVVEAPQPAAQGRIGGPQ